MKFILNFLQSYNWVLIGSALLLSSIGLLEIYSIQVGEVFIEANLVQRQATFILIGLLAMIVVGRINWRYYSDSVVPSLGLYIASILLLGGLFIFGVEINSSLSWYSLGPVNFEPVELVKILVLIFLARFFSVRYQQMFQLRHTLISLAYFAIPLGLVLAQPDAGSAVILVLLWAGSVLVAGMKPRQVVLLLSGGIITILLAWSFAFADYQKDRVMLLVNPDLDPQGAGYNLRQSLIAVGAGGIFGTGLGLGTQTQLSFLPEAQTDFIFSSIAEETGVLGVVVVLSLYAIVLFHIFKIGINSQHAFQKLFAFSFALLLFVQAFINVSMSLGLLPVIGITLPFISLGGSSVVASWIGIGILHSIRNYR